uniref:VWFD domain-containing protein n=1 Tax=Stegastes partitus TaxID=144197 RepID=A0A3B4YYT4_9TELE
TTCENGETCVQSQSQCWVLGGAHYDTFDGQVFEFQGNCTYTLIQKKTNDASENNALWVGVQKDRTFNQASSFKKMQLPVTLQFGLVRIHQSGVFVVVDTNLGIRVKYDCSHIAAILLSNKTQVHGMCGNNNGIKEDDFRTPQGATVNAAAFGWSWRVSAGEAQCADRNVANKWISLHETYLWSPQSPFHPCKEVVNYTKISSTLSIFDLCSSDDTQRALCSMLEAAACQKAAIQISKWRNSTFCRMSCPENSHYELCGPQCPAVCTDLSSQADCGCEEGCQRDPGYVLSDGQCVLLSDCGCMHEGQYHPIGHFYSEKSCQKCDCIRGEVTCTPLESC